jgi:hypothetical protein
MACIHYETPIFVLLSSEAEYCNLCSCLHNGISIDVPNGVPHGVPNCIPNGIPHGVSMGVCKDILNDTVSNEDPNTIYKVASRLVPNVPLFVSL